MSKQGTNSDEEWAASGIKDIHEGARLLQDLTARDRVPEADDLLPEIATAVLDLLVEAERLARRHHLGKDPTEAPDCECPTGQLRGQEPGPPQCPLFEVCDADGDLYDRAFCYRPDAPPFDGRE